jgi:tetratricopeptide (TPR) repeat protein/transcriptional regulator with XRE-family HTH domain
MPEATRSPFGKALRAYRQRRGLSQAALADLIAERARDDQAFAALGLISDRTISNLEAVRADASKFVRPRPHTVRILATALNIPSGSEEETAFLQAAELTRIRSASPSAEQPVGIEGQIFVSGGREDIFQCLKTSWNQGLAGAPQIIFLAGDAGAGKTHLIRELCMGIQDEGGVACVAWGECTGGASTVSPYLPFLQAMNSLLGLLDRKDDPATRYNQDAARQAASIDALLTIAPALIGTLVDEPALVACVEWLGSEYPDLLTKLDRVLGVRNAADTSSRLDQMVRFLVDVAASTPIILVLEDLHWAGEHTASLLLHLQRQLWQRHNLPLMIVCSYRPSDLAIASPTIRHLLESVINEIGRQVGNVVVDLGTTIGNERGQAFIHDLLQTLSIAPADEDALADFLFSRTEGHPLFSTELIRWLQDTGGMERDADGLWHRTASATERKAPGKVRAVIAERIDRLPAHLRSILDAASVHGTTVAVDLIAGLEDISPDELQDAIDNQLVKRYRLLVPGNPGRVGERRLHFYRFRHALFQEFLYEELSLRERERLHELSATRAVELLGTGRHILSGEIAFHYEQAHLFDDAMRHAYAAATLALRQLNYEVADHWLQKTETHARQANDLWHVHAARNSRVMVLRGNGHIEESYALALQVVTDARREGFSDLESDAEYLLGLAYYDKGELWPAVEHFSRAVDIHCSLGHQAEVGEVEAMLSHTFYRLGAYDQALVHARQAHESAETMGNDIQSAEALLAVGNCEVDLGMYRIAISTYRRARAIYQGAGEVRGELLTELNTGLCHIQLGDWQLAIALLEKTKHTTDVLRTPRLKTFACHYLSMAFEGLGDYESARRETRHSMELRKSFGQDGHIGDNLTTLLRIALAEGDAATTRKYLRLLEAWNQEHHGEGAEDPARMYLCMARTYAMLGEPEQCRKAVQEGHALLMERAGHIGDDESRPSYLENVPANRKLIAWHLCGTPTDE